ncbi:MAG: hypothetical protein JNK29_00920 [Anaerolineales bacterium]|nr:hypothetical protein [Anaerolineales bacterium]
MNANFTSLNWNALAAGAVGLVTTSLLAAYLLGIKLPVITSDRAAFLAVAGLGFLMCMLGMGKVVTGLGWTHPLSILGSVVGALILGLVLVVLAGWRLPFLADDRAALIAVVVLGLVKWGLGVFSHVVLKV